MKLPIAAAFMNREEFKRLLGRIEIRGGEFYVPLPNGRTLRFDYKPERDPVEHAWQYWNRQEV